MKTWLKRGICIALLILGAGFSGGTAEAEYRYGGYHRYHGRYGGYGRASGYGRSRYAYSNRVYFGYSYSPRYYGGYYGGYSPYRGNGYCY